jgi:hypothetical protein
MQEAVAVALSDSLAEEPGILSAEALRIPGGEWGVVVIHDPDGSWSNEKLRRHATLVFGVEVQASHDGKTLLV